MRRFIALLLFPSLVFAAPNFKLEERFSGFGVIWGMTFLDAQTLLLTERSGAAYLVDLGSGKKRSLAGLPSVYASGQGGLLDAVATANAPNENWIYVTYSKQTPDGGITVLARAQLKDNAFSNWQTLLETTSAFSGGHHFGSRIAFDNSGHVFFSIGDRGERESAQDLSNHAGSIVRLKLDGSVPKDNPFVGVKNALPEIWSYGHRNPQGLAFDVAKSRLWAIEHGPRGGDELNRVEKGKNYGWPVISYGKEYWGPVAVGEGTHKAGMEQPVKYFVPSIAPGSLLLYTGKMFPEWKGTLFAGALKLQHLNHLIVDDSGRMAKEERFLEDLNERIRALAQAPDGSLYFSTDSGKIYQIFK